MFIFLLVLITLLSILPQCSVRDTGNRELSIKHDALNEIKKTTPQPTAHEQQIIPNDPTIVEQEITKVEKQLAKNAEQQEIHKQATKKKNNNSITFKTKQTQQDLIKEDLLLNTKKHNKKIKIQQTP